MVIEIVWFRRWLCGFTALAGLCSAAWAQDVPPVPQAGDPPARVGRLAQLSGPVTFRAQDSDDFSPAALNYPVTAGNAIQVPRPGRAEVDVDADRFALPGGSDLHLTRLDDNALAATLSAGEVCFALAPVPSGRSYSIQTPRGLVAIATGGRYAVVAGDTDHPTLVTVAAGAATVTAGGATLAIAPGQAASLTGQSADQAQGTMIAAAPDQCLTGLAAGTGAPAQIAGPPPPPAVLQMTGGAALAGYGVWQPEPDYGNVWFPQVAVGWVPYRQGHWAFVVPWGWTWVDDAPWGFAPFHYGRWAEFHGRWGWTPGEDRGPPVYAPALVTFFGLGVAGASVGWVPLAPREPYYPWYRASGAYVRQINVRQVTDTTTVVHNYTSNTYNNIVVNHYTNATAATLVPAAALSRSQQVAPLIQPLAAQQLAAARPAVGQLANAPASAAAFRLPVPEHPAQAMRRAAVPAAAAPSAAVVLPPAAAPRTAPPMPTLHGAAPVTPPTVAAPHEAARPAAQAAQPVVHAGSPPPPPPRHEPAAARAPEGHPSTSPRPEVHRPPEVAERRPEAAPQHAAADHKPAPRPESSDKKLVPQP